MLLSAKAAVLKSPPGRACACTGADAVSFKELLESWRHGAAAPRTVSTYAVRLPVDDAAQLAALADMFPGRSVEQLISELLAVALRELAATMPYVPGKRVISTDEQGDPVYEDVGPTPRFMELARQHRRALEARSRRATRPVKARRRRP
ncbi:MAG TPA: pilin assembly protein [Steroidobacteraceae bacterium]|nr:pilin assembly protein [Steroidobacteraceae bacterium]